MKELKSNVQASLLCALSIIEIFVMLFFRSQSKFVLYYVFLVSNLGVCCIRFAYQIAKWVHKQTLKLRSKNIDTEDEEPSDLIIGYAKGLGYLLVALSQVVLFI